MNRKIPLGMTMALMLLTAALVFCGATLLTTNNINLMLSDNGRNINAKIEEIGAIVDENFYEEIDHKTILDGIAKGYISALGDRYSTYMSDSDYSSDSLNKAGKREGVGITVAHDVDTKYLYITRVVPDGPAARAGLLAGDQITHVGELALNADNYSQAMEAIAGEQGTTVELTVLRGEETIQRTVVRSQFEDKTVMYRMMGDIAYIEITSFNHLTLEQFNAALESVTPTAKALLFDLRGNSGGLLNETYKMIDALCPAGTIASAVYKSGRTEVLYTSNEKEVKLPMAVLINGETASSAELFAAALRDFEKGPLIGEKSYGKGVMQQTYELKDKSAVRITIAHFNPPGGVSFHGTGLEPKIAVTPTDEQKKYYYKLNDTNDPFILAGIDYLQGVK